LIDALRTFVTCEHGTQGATHIRPLHWYVACRLVIEGGFHPDEVTPRPPLVVRQAGRTCTLEYDPERGGSGERTLLGGLKTKAVDVVVTKEGIGPVLAISLKGTQNAFRNLTNRMEEAVGDCTNLHIAYPALVYGFLQIMRGTRQAHEVAPNDVAVSRDGRVVDAILRYHDVLARLADRRDVRADITKYEAIALALVSPQKRSLGSIMPGFPEPESPLRLEGFFRKLYDQYDSRFVYAAPALESSTRRLVWESHSSVLGDSRIDYEPRVE
jgi:hypothetical protein